MKKFNITFVEKVAEGEMIGAYEFPVEAKTKKEAEKEVAYFAKEIATNDPSFVISHSFVANA